MDRRRTRSSRTAGSTRRASSTGTSGRDCRPSARAALVDDARSRLAATSTARGARAAAASSRRDACRRGRWTRTRSSARCSRRAAGRRPPSPAYTHWYQRLDGAAPRRSRCPRCRAGYRVRHVLLPDDVEARVDVHRAAFAPSRMTGREVQERWRTMPPLRARARPRRRGARRVARGVRAGVVGPRGAHGRVRAGRDASRRTSGAGSRGPSTSPALRLLRDLGARDALVFSRTSNAASEALYASVGLPGGDAPPGLDALALMPRRGMAAETSRAAWASEGP